MSAAARRNWRTYLARFGYGTKGIIYLLIGGLAVTSVVSASGSLGGSTEAVQTIEQQPFGRVLLAIIGAGLIAYSLWQMSRSVTAFGEDSSSSLRIAKGLGHAASGLIHGGVAVVTIQLVLGEPSSAPTARTVLGDVLSVGGVGRLLVLLAGVLVIGFAVRELYQGAMGDFAKKISPTTSARARRWLIASGRGGHLARGVVFALVGVSLGRAAMSSSAAQFDGVGGALRDLASQPSGAVLVFAAAMGLALFGGYELAMARYRRISI